MRFIFRPLTSYAVHTRKWCRDIAAGIKGNGLVRRVLDGFLIQVTKRNGTAIADVIDPPGDIYVAAIQSPWWVTLNPSVNAYYARWHPGYLIEGEAGDRYGRNMTYAVTDEAQYEALALRRYLRPSAWIPVPAASWSEAKSGDAVRSRQSGTWPTFSQSRVWGTDGVYQNLEGDGSVDVYRLTPGEVRGVEEFLFNRVEQAHLDDGLWWRSLTVDMAHLLDLPPYVNTTESAASCYGNKVVYVVYAAHIRHTKNTDELPSVSPETALLAVGRVDLTPGETPEDPPTGVVTLLGRMSGRDLLAEDVPQVLYDREVPGGGPGILIEHLNGAYNPVVAANAVGYNGWGVQFSSITSASNPEQASFTGFRFTDGIWADVDASVPPACVGLSDAVDVLFVGQSSRRVAPVSATGRVLYIDDMVTVDLNDLGGIDYNVALNHTFTYLVRFGAGATVRCIARHTAAIHDPALRNKPLVVFNPVLTYLDTDGEVEQSRFVCLRIQSGPVAFDGGDERPWRRVIAPTADGVTVVVISGDGSIVDLDLGSTYPVTYPVRENRQTPESSTDDKFSSPFRRPGYGWGFTTLRLEGKLAGMDVAPACEYAPGMVAIIVAPKAGYSSGSQTAKLAVFRIADGSKVAESEFDLPFTVVNGGADARGLAVQWSVTCVERGEVNDGGGLTRYARLLFTEQTHHGPSVMYTATDLKSLNTVAAWGVGWGEHMTGPAYYLGSALAPAKVGRSTGRSFLKGKPVTP